VEGQTTDVHHLKRLKTDEPSLGLPIRSDEEKGPLGQLQLLRRGMGGKRKASVKSHLMLSASMASG
jgi:hypothetical protein